MFKVLKLKKIVVFVIIFCTIFVIFNYKNFLFGNNIFKNRSDRNIEDFLVQCNKYTADITVTVNSNKTQNSYEIHQEVRDNYSMQEITSGDNIKGIKIALNGENLKISNSNLKLEKVYENMLNNAMFLNSFLNDYKNEENEVKSYEENDEIVFEVRLNKNPNTYIKYKKLYVNKENLKPQKMEIKDNAQNETICIIYNNIELN